MRRRIAGALLLFLTAGTAFAQEKGYTDEWKEFKTKLIRKEKSFQKGDDLNEKRSGFEPAVYESDGMELKAMLHKGGATPTDPRPAVIYLHGGFALSYGQLEYPKRFAEAGFVVLAPSWRGENGNPGFFELFMGEVRDAKAAVRWLAVQDFVDQDRIYVFGWSVGGGIALNLSLHDDISIRMSGSSAGIYDRDLIRAWATEDDYIKFPYDHTDALENKFRLPVYNLRSMVRPHIAYIGADDGFDDSEKLVSGLYPYFKTRLALEKVPGDHVSSVNAALERFINEIRKDAKKN